MFISYYTVSSLCSKHRREKYRRFIYSTHTKCTYSLQSDGIFIRSGQNPDILDNLMHTLYSSITYYTHFGKRIVNNSIQIM